MSNTAIQAKKLSRHFANAVAVDQLDLTIPTGSIFGLLGINGAGKTTLIRMALGHLHPTEGQLSVLNSEPHLFSEATRARIAYVSENMNLPGHLTPEKAMNFSASIYTQWDAQLADTLLKKFDLQGKGPFKTLSKGQKQKTCILLAICQNADLLVLDEPAAGLDVVSRREFLDQMLEIACKPGRTILLSSHLLSDLERVVDRLAIIHQGRALVSGNLEDLKAGVRKIHWPAALSEAQLSETFKLARFEHPTPDETLATVSNFSQDRMSTLVSRHVEAQNANIFALNLEDMFVELIGQKSTQANTNQENLS